MMKKLNVLLIVAILVTALIAQALPAKLVRLEVYNDTGENVYIRLEGITTNQFYYLTVPPTTRANWFQPKVYTIMTDYYTRTTWSCGGVETTGQLRIVKNFRLRFTACATLPKRTAYNAFWDLYFRAPNFGEPTMEKVVFFSAVSDSVWVKIHFGVADDPATVADEFANLGNLWFNTKFGNTINDPDADEGYSVPFELQDYCAPNNCFYHAAFIYHPELLNPDWFYFSGFAYGPGGNKFRYRY